MDKKKVVSFVIVVVMLCLSGISQAATSQIAVSSLGYDEDIVVAGARTNTTITFPLPAVSLLPGSALNMTIEPGPRLSGWSSFSFYLNNRLASTITVSQLWANQTVKLPIPAGLTAGQPLRLDIKANIAAGEDVGADSLNGYLYYTLRNSSNMVLNFNQLPAKTPAGFFLGLSGGLVVIIPDNPAMEEIAAGAWTYGLMQKSFSYLPVKFAFASERNQIPGQPRIWVATRNHLPASLVPAVQGTSLMDPETLVITADDGTGLKAEVQRLAAMLAQGTPLGAIGDDTQMAADKNKEVVFFGRTEPQEGISSVPIEFDLYPAMLSEAPRRLIFHLEGRYSASVGKPPRMVVFFNGSLVHSETLDDSGVLTRDISLPKSLAPGTQNKLRIEFNYPAAKDSQGGSGLVQSAQILPSSFFTGMGTFATDKFGWDNFGMVLNKNGVLLLDDSPSPAKIKSAAEMVGLMNRQLPPGEFAWPEFRAIADYRGINNAAYLFIVGTADDIPADLQQVLPLRNIRDDKVYQSYRNGRDQGRNAMIGQIGTYRGMPVAAIVTANDSAGLLAGLRKLGLSRKLAGNLFVLTEDGSLMSMDRREKGIMANIQQDGMDMLATLWWAALRWIDQYQGPLLIGLGIIAVSLFCIRLVSWLSRRLRRSSDARLGKVSPSFSPLTEQSTGSRYHRANRAE